MAERVTVARDELRGMVREKLAPLVDAERLAACVDAIDSIFHAVAHETERFEITEMRDEEERWLYQYWLAARVTVDSETWRQPRQRPAYREVTGNGKAVLDAHQ